MKLKIVGAVANGSIDSKLFWNSPQVKQTAFNSWGRAVCFVGSLVVGFCVTYLVSRAVSTFVNNSLIVALWPKLLPSLPRFLHPAPTP